MTGSDDSILESLDTLPEGYLVPPQAIQLNLAREGVDITYRTIQRRLKKLAAAGLVERIEEPRGYCRITDKGRAYLTGELDAEELQLDEDEEQEAGEE